MNELVIYKKDQQKIIYELIEKKSGKVVIKGINYRTKLEVSIEDVEKVDESKLIQESKKNEKYFLCFKEERVSRKILKGTVLHIDADKEYLQKSKELYDKVGVYCYPCYCNEMNLKEYIRKTDFQFDPDVVVVTGHDYFEGGQKKELANYSNSKFFVDAVLEIKKKFPNCIIVAGACQSNYEALMAKGANFASSPRRKNVHIYDPAVIAINVCVTPFKNLVNFENMGKYIANLREAYGGIETYGKMKILY